MTVLRRAILACQQSRHTDARWAADVTDRFTAQAPDGPIVGVAAGPGDGTPLLLPHGGPGISDNMDMLDVEAHHGHRYRLQVLWKEPEMIALCGCLSSL